MDLATPELIASLIECPRQPRKAPAQARMPAIARGRISNRRGCQCGTCSKCLDNARWDRIFREKFADPDYYKPKPVPFGSSLQWLR